MFSLDRNDIYLKMPTLCLDCHPVAVISCKSVCKSFLIWTNNQFYYPKKLEHLFIFILALYPGWGCGRSGAYPQNAGHGT